MFRLLYKVGNNKKGFSKLKFSDKSGKEDTWIQKFFEQHLENIFPRLKLFVFGEKGTKYNFKGGQLDAISWYKDEQTFIIFEYKSIKKPSGVLDQICTYLTSFQNEKNWEARKKIMKETLGKFLPKKDSEAWWPDDIKWEKLKLVWIGPRVPDFHHLFPISIIWVKAEWYENDGEQALVLESKEEKFLEKISEEGKISDKSKVQSLKIATNITKMFKELNNFLLPYSLWKKEKVIFGYRTSIYYRDPNFKSLLFSLVSRRESIIIRFNLQKLSEKKKVLENKFEIQVNKGSYREEFDSEYIINNEEKKSESFELLRTLLKKKLNS